MNASTKFYFYEPSKRNEELGNSATLQNFIVDHSAMVDFIASSDLEDAKFLETLARWEPELIKQEINDYLGGYPQTNLRREYQHYFFRLSPRLKEVMKNEKIWLGGSEHESLYGLESPAFYHAEQGGIWAALSAWEGEATLALTQEEYRDLTAKGVAVEEISTVIPGWDYHAS